MTAAIAGGHTETINTGINNEFVSRFNYTLLERTKHVSNHALTP